MNLLRFPLLTFSAAMWLSAGVQADEALSGELVLATGEQQQGRLVQLTAGELQLQLPDDQLQTFADGRWMRWRHPAEPQPRPRIQLADGSILVAKQDWTGKSPVSVDAEWLTIDNETFGKLSTPRSAVRCLLIKAAQEPVTQQHFYLKQAAEASAVDRVWLLDGDLLSGLVISFDGTTLQLELAGQTIPVLANSIAAVAFAGRKPQGESSQPRCVVGLADGSLIEATDVSLEAGELTLTAMFGNCQSNRAKDLVFLQSLADSIAYLSNSKPVDYRHTPYFTGEWPLASDRNLAGGPLGAAGQRYLKGLSMHSASRVVYRAVEGANRFVAQAAIDQSASQQGSVVLRVALVTADGLKTAYTSGVVRQTDEPINVSVALDNCSAIVLIVDYADYGDQGDHANWLDARMVIDSPGP